jgi:putative redox protein
MDLAPQLLIGHSLGGAAVLAAAPGIASATAVATIGAPAEPAHVLQRFGADLETIRREGRAEVTLAGRRFEVGRGFLEDTEAEVLTDRLAHLRKALLVLHAPRDMEVGLDNATRIFVAARHPKSFVSLDEADHLLGRAEDADYAAGVIAAWAARYVDRAGGAADTTPEGMVRVSEADAAGFLQDVSIAGRHRMQADEPQSHGGTDLGPSPYQLVCAGLGACTAMTIRMYARRKGWPLEHVSVDVAHDRIHAEDCAGCESRTGKVDRFRRVVRIEGDLDAGQRARLMEIADRCPVHRTLEGEVAVETVEAGAP